MQTLYHTLFENASVFYVGMWANLDPIPVIPQNLRFLQIYVGSPCLCDGWKEVVIHVGTTALGRPLFGIAFICGRAWNPTLQMNISVIPLPREGVRRRRGVGLKTNHILPRLATKTVAIPRVAFASTQHVLSALRPLPEEGELVPCGLFRVGSWLTALDLNSALLILLLLPYPNLATDVKKFILGSDTIQSRGGENMDWLKGMNNVVRHIEENLTQPIQYSALSQIVGCSVYEFSRIFSFMAGMSISEYIRRRRLSQAAFDIQSGEDKIIDIALKYCYESPTTFTRAFKELHGFAPLEARKNNPSLKIYPPISFSLTIKGGKEMKHRIEKKDVMGFKVNRLCGFRDPVNIENGIPMHFFNYTVAAMTNFREKDAPNRAGLFADIKKRAKEDGYGEDWQKWQSEKVENVILIDHGIWNLGPLSNTDGTPLNPCFENGQIRVFLGRMNDVDSKHSIPAATWAVFTFDNQMTEQNLSEAYTRILTEWMPISGYNRDMTVPHMEQYHAIDDTWEIWLPVMDK